MNGKWINIFKVGTHTDSSGRSRTWTNEDLNHIVENYSARTEDAPLVFGHPKSDAPAQGWIARVKNKAGILCAQIAQISDAAKKKLDNGGYKYGSLSLTPDLKIRHFGLLGAVPPAVKGLGEVEFQADDGMTVIINFNESVPPKVNQGEPKPEEPDMTKELEAKIKELEAKAKTEAEARQKAEAELQARESDFAEAAAAERKKQILTRVEKLVEDGKLLPAHKDKTLAFCEAMDGGEDMSFSEAEGKKPLVDHFLEFMADGKTHGLLQEFNAPEPAEPSATDDLTKYV